MEDAPKRPRRTYACSMRKIISVICLGFFMMVIGKLYVSAICEEHIHDFNRGEVSKPSIGRPDYCSFLRSYRDDNGVAETSEFAEKQKADDVKPSLTDKPISLPRLNGWTNEIPSSSTAGMPLHLPLMQYLGKNNFKRTFFARSIFKESSIFKSGPDTSKLSFDEKVAVWKRSLPYQPEDVNLLALKPPNFLENYKNPCWEEMFTSKYNESYYTIRADVRSQLNMMTQVLHDRRYGRDYHRIRCLPYFLMIGQPKCGSTDLYRKLVAHPDVSGLPPSLKEPHWWTRTRLGRLNSRGHVVSFGQYTDIYDYAAYKIEQETGRDETATRFHKSITGEASMSTFWDNDHWWAMVGNENSTEPRVLIQHYIRHLLPDVRLVLILRNPTDRMYSDFLYFRKDRKSPADFHTAVSRAVRLYKECMAVRTTRACVYDSFLKQHAQIRLRVGLYSVFLADWLAVFPRRQLLIIRTEQYGRNTTTVLRQLYAFLGLRKLTLDEEEEIVSMKKANTRRESDLQYGDMLPETRKLLDNFYEPFNRQLTEMLGDESFLWNDVT